MKGAGHAAILALALLSCHKEPKSAPLQDAGPVDATVMRVPAPNSVLAQELGADDAGRGTYRFMDDGPACGPSPRVDRAGAPLDGIASGMMHFYATQGPSPKQPGDDARSPIQLTIRAPQIVVSTEPFTIKTTLTNRGKVPFIFERGAEGSTEHWTSPFIDTYMKPKGSDVVSRWTYDATVGRCGNVPTREAEDFITLKPGEKREEPFGDLVKDSLHVSVWTPGTYTFWVIYSACQGPEIGHKDGQDAPYPENWFEGTIVSNAITVEVAAVQ